MVLDVAVDVPVLLGILAFAGVLIGVLAGSRGQKLLDRRNNRHHNPGNPSSIVCPLGGGGEAHLASLTNEIRAQTEELKGIRTAQGKVLDGLGAIATDIGIIKDRGQR